MLKRVTFSGIDQQTKVQDLKKLYEKYPFVEFVFLYSQQANQKGQGRPIVPNGLAIPVEAIYAPNLPNKE